MNDRHVAALLALLIALGIATLVWIARPAPACAHGLCLPTFCGSSAECPGPCACAIPSGRATGTCVEIRW